MSSLNKYFASKNYFMGADNKHSPKNCAVETSAINKFMRAVYSLRTGR